MSLIFQKSERKEKIWGYEDWILESELLIKIIKADSNLSVQLHPDDDYAKKYENSLGKSECWYILDAEDGAEIVIGHNAQSVDEFKQMAQNGQWEKLLRRVKVKKGDFFQIDPGTVHAICGGVKILEVQQVSDITYRLYDYDRLENGRPRELHLKQCFDNVVCPFVEKENNHSGNLLGKTAHYAVKKMRVNKKLTLKTDRELSVICIDGEGCANGSKIYSGDSFIVPMGEEVTLMGDMEIITAAVPKKARIGVDLGGTNIAIGLVDEDCRIVERISRPTHRDRGIEAICENIREMCKSLMENEDYFVTSIGVGCPGTIDAENGVVVYANNIAMENTPLADMIGKDFNIPVYVENDANVAALGEYMAFHKEKKSFVLITLGTGVGGGLVLDGKVFRGFNGAGFEAGHMILHPDGEKCTCGNMGCLEAYTSATALNRRGGTSCEDVFRLAKNGDEFFKRVLDEYFDDLSIGIANIINLIQPEVLAIGGGVSNAGDDLILPLRKRCSRMDYNKFLKKTEIVKAQLMNDAGIIGAAML